VKPPVTELLPPLPETMAKYGLTPASWRQLADRQGGVCAVCKKLPTTGRLHIDHVHAKGWSKMPHGARAIYVRGLLCHWCNRSYVGRGITVAKSEAVTAYLKQSMPFNVAVRGDAQCAQP
jgi:hypothetical protein